MAAFTTCHSRLKLYESLDTLQQRVLYYDTDSVIYRWRPNQPSITTGDFLGDMTDELDGDVITEFVSGGAKNYGYLTRRQSGVQGTWIHFERPWLRHSQFSHYERQHSLGIKLASGLSPTFEHYHPSLFQTGFREETNSSGSAHEAVWVGVR